MGCMVRANNIDDALIKAPPQAVLMALLANGWVHLRQGAQLAVTVWRHESKMLRCHFDGRDVFVAR